MEVRIWKLRWSRRETDKGICALWLERRMLDSKSIILSCPEAKLKYRMFMLKRQHENTDEGQANCTDRRHVDKECRRTETKLKVNGENKMKKNSNCR
jgi:hypothetical protein